MSDGMQFMSGFVVGSAAGVLASYCFMMWMTRGGEINVSPLMVEGLKEPPTPTTIIPISDPTAVDAHKAGGE